MHKQNIKRQHYVWRYYLKPWTVNKQICCLRDNNIFKASLMKIAQKRYFYRTEELNNEEISLIVKIIEALPPENHELLFETFKVYLASCNGDEYLKKNGIEIFHSIVESRAIDFIDKARVGNINFLNEEQSRIDFSKFLARQYCRTRKIEMATMSNINSIKLPNEYIGSCDIKKIMKAVSFLTSDSIGNWIFSESNIFLLENNTEVNFITSDQPIYNLKSKENISTVDMELYYPLNTKFALLCTKLKNVNTMLSKQDVQKYNTAIFKFSHEVVFAKYVSDLESYK